MSAGTVSAEADRRAGSTVLAEALVGHRNSLGLIRLVLALLVILDHAFPLGDFGADPFWAYTRGQTSLGGIAVAGFFAISGYLIAKSGMSADVLQFLWRRILRIFPAYWLILLITALIVAPIIWWSEGRGLSNYFTVGGNGPVNYFTANWTLTIGTYGIHDLLADSTPYGREVGGSVFNGSIWTLSYEWGLYLVIAVLVAFGVLRSARIVVPLLAAFFLVLQMIAPIGLENVQAIIPPLADPHAIALGLTFLIGAAFATYADRIPFNNGLGALSLVVLVASLRVGGFATVGTIAGAYFVLFLAVRLPRWLQWIGQKNDYSYGVYLYGFLVQQVTAHLGWYKLGYIPYALIAMVISFGCAWVSWHVVERPAMALKSWGPGRGISHWREFAMSRWRARQE